MEVTRGIIEAIVHCQETASRDGINCRECIAKDLCDDSQRLYHVCAALLAEMDKPKVWDGAPEWATESEIRWTTPTRYSDAVKRHTREQPKSRAREIAEEAATENGNYCKEAADKIEAAILRDREERKQA